MHGETELSLETEKSITHFGEKAGRKLATFCGFHWDNALDKNLIIAVL